MLTRPNETVEIVQSKFDLLRHFLTHQKLAHLEMPTQLELYKKGTYF